MKLITISDTHNLHPYMQKLPDGDVLIHSGDSTMGGSIPEITRFLVWFGGQPHKHKVMISGNHDFGFENKNRDILENIARENGITYLRDSGTEINGLRFWGAPWTPWFHDWAFNLERGGKEIIEKWSRIPDDTNILITHGPARGILDRTKYGDHAGCEKLLERISQLKHLKYHIFGHIHEGHGVREVDGITHVNACTCTAKYAPINTPITLETP